MPCGTKWWDVMISVIGENPVILKICVFAEGRRAKKKGYQCELSIGVPVVVNLLRILLVYIPHLNSNRKKITN